MRHPSRALAALLTGIVLLAPSARAQGLSSLVTRWERVGLGLEDALVTSLAVDGQGNLFAGLEEYGTAAVFALPRTGKQWRPIADGLDFKGAARVTPDSQGGVYALQNGSVYSLPQGALAWKKALGDSSFEVNFLFEPGDDTYWTYHKPFDVNTIFYVSDARGKRTNLQKTPNIPWFVEVRDAALGPDGAVIVAAGANAYRVSRTSTGGVMAPLGNDLPASAVSVAIAPNGAVYLATGAELSVEKRYAFVFRMTPARNSWVDVTANLPEAPPYKLRFDRAGNLFAATGGKGVYVLPVGLSTWMQVGSGLSGGAVDVRDILIAGDGSVYLATAAGVFKGVR